MDLVKKKIIKIYKVIDITNEYHNYTDEHKKKYRSVFNDDMILNQPLYKVVCKVEYNGKTEIVTRIWTKSEYESVEKNKYYYS